MGQVVNVFEAAVSSGDIDIFPFDKPIYNAREWAVFLLHPENDGDGFRVLRQAAQLFARTDLSERTRFIIWQDVVAAPSVAALFEAVPIKPNPNWIWIVLVQAAELLRERQTR